MRAAASVALRMAAVVVLVAGSAWADEDAPVEVVVRDTKLARASRRDPSAASSVIRREELTRPGADAAEVLAAVPGVQLSRSGSSADLATASVRGATSAQSPVYLAGIRLNDDVTGTADLSTVPLWMLDRVEVFRGNAPEDVDRLGIGGAVLFEPRQPRRPMLGAGLGIGSFGERSGWVGGAQVTPGADSLWALRRAHADNDYRYVDDAGTVATTSDDRSVRRLNADADDWDAWAISRYEPAPGARVTAVLNAFRRDQGVTGLGVIPARHARGSVQRFLAGVSVRSPCASASSLGAAEPCSLELSTSALVASHGISDPFEELSLGSSNVSSEGRRVGQSAHVVIHPDEALRLRVGGGEELELLAIDAVGATSLRARRDVSRADASARLQAADGFELGALGALECHGTRGPGRNERCDVLAPAGRLGAVLRLGDGLSLLGNLGRYVRVPTLGELYGQSAAVLGSPDLAPERGLGADLGARLEGAHEPGVAYWLEAFAFARSVSELIAYRRSTFGAVRPYNIGRARMLGLELHAALRAFEHLGVEANATFLDPRDVTPGRQLSNDLVPFQSRLTANGRVELFHEPKRLANRIAVGGSARYRASRIADPAGLVVLGEQLTLGADASALFWSRRLALRAAVENVLDARQIDLVGYPLPGRSYHATAELWW